MRMSKASLVKVYRCKIKGCRCRWWVTEIPPVSGQGETKREALGMLRNSLMDLLDDTRAQIWKAKP